MNHELQQLGIAICDQLAIPGHQVWIAPMQSGRFKMASPPHVLHDHPVIRQIEVFWEKDSLRFNQCRIYGHATATDIPTVILSEDETVRRYAKHDGTPVHKLHESIGINYPQVL